MSEVTNHEDVHHHGIDAEDDGSKVFRGDPYLDHLDDCEGVSHPPEYPARRAEPRDISFHLPARLATQF